MEVAAILAEYMIEGKGYLQKVVAADHQLRRV